MRAKEKAKELLAKAADKYKSEGLKKILQDEVSSLYGKDIFICLENICNAVITEGNTLDNLKQATNVYNGPIFMVNNAEGRYIIKEEPDFEAAIEKLGDYSFCFDLSPYHIINTYLVILEAQIAGLDLPAMIEKGKAHIEDLIEDSIQKYQNWNHESLKGDKPKLVMPVGAAGCGKSTFYKELSNVVNISCDNVRYLLFKDFGPCFASWESAISWWVVNYLADAYLKSGISVFYNGVNTDLEYRSPITMEADDNLFKGIPYDVRIVYFEPPVKLNSDELEELKKINLWQNPIENLDMSSLSPNVKRIMDMIKNNYKRTIARTKDIQEGNVSQDPFDVLYSVPAAIVKLFVEQSFLEPKGDNVVKIPRKEIPDEAEREEFYRKYAELVLSA